MSNLLTRFYIRKTKIIEVLVSQIENNDSDEEEKLLSTTEVSPSDANSKELCIFNNPLILKGRNLDLGRKHSFEDLDLH